MCKVEGVEGLEGVCVVDLKEAALPAGEEEVAVFLFYVCVCVCMSGWVGE